MVATVGRSLNTLAIRQSLSLSQEKLASVLKVSTKTVSRWERSQSQPDGQELQRLAKLEEIRALGLMVYSIEGLKLFLATPLPLFGGHSAGDLIYLGDFDPVIAALAADFEGAAY